MQFTKSERRQMRELAGATYEAELHSLIEGLDREFSRWRTGEILSSELQQAIHEFHKQKSRDLWSMYQNVDEAFIVARGISLDLIAESKVPPALLAKLKPAIIACLRDE